MLLTVSETYPNTMTVNYTRDAAGDMTGIEYVKTTHCTEKCVWFTDSVLASIHGQWLEQTSTLSRQAYTYDAAGRLTQVQDTPVGKGCVVRIYAYDEDTNRTNLTTREPGSGGQCATTGGSEEKHSYDGADRLTDTGIVYNTFGDITSLPAVDAGGSELTSVYYADNQLASETQNGQTIGYNLDPDGRTLETVSTGKSLRHHQPLRWTRWYPGVDREHHGRNGA
jgi:YD repeat-containing protein